MTRKSTVTLPDGRAAQAVEIPVETANERWSEYTLQDGTVFRVKINLVSVVRIEGEYDPQGVPLYQINAAPALGFVEVPEHLKRNNQ
jgi:hypothetical protein